MSKRRVVSLLFICINVCFLLAGFAYLWHYIPASSFTGVAPPPEFDTLEGWYAYNEMTGAAILFVGVANLFFFGFASRKFSTTRKLIFALLFATIINVITAGIAAEFFMNFINL